MPVTQGVLAVEALGFDTLGSFFARLGLTLARVNPGQSIPGSFWGDEEAGLIGDTIYVRDDTPVHSAMHEAGHYVCMDQTRRDGLHTNAGGTYDEENAVCYWQILASAHLDGMDHERMCADMDRWGYTFRLGSAAAWFAQDAEDAHAWLVSAGLIDAESGALIIGVRH
ncbi:hypothetical protein SSPSH_000950 [Salinisphaera shabanensis E1L3A]|uniref:Uncharacterized protein n=1 Tax=Salinisphaera shabanensis E1L3A TaxID=1033802 RepID=U2E8Q9_9GAMM|nr:hypothetical protein [Salinisphaera shabanensis]ERJ20086.1 hypothetical protein SSPSH_000950 [Salinisphaera shabanensis E1L3A]